MNLLDKINQFLLLFVETLRRLGNWRIWAVLLGYLALHWLVLYGHFRYVSTPFYGWLTPWIDFIGGDRAQAFSHYPQHFFYLGRYAGWAKLSVSLLIEGPVLGVVAMLFWRSFTKAPLEGPQRGVLGRWFNLVLAWAGLNALMMAVGHFLPTLASPFLNGPRRVLAFSYMVLPLCFAMVFAVLYFALPRVAVLGENAPLAIWRSVVQFVRRPFLAFFGAALILALPVFLNAVTSRPASIIDGFRPELVYWLLSASLVFEMVANFFWMGTAVSFLIEPEK